jgi:hypothetical protein
LVRSVIDNEVEKSRHDLLVSKVDIVYEVSDFINHQQSEKTKTSYLGDIKKYLWWTDFEKIDPRKITRKDIERYENYLTHIKVYKHSNYLTPASECRKNYTAISSFCEASGMPSTKA